MSDVTCQFAAEDQTEGCRVLDELVGLAFGEATGGPVSPANAVAGCRQVLELGLFIRLLNRGISWQNAAQMVEQQTPDMH